MANWEITNDSTTNYLRVQDQTAQNPIDFHENGTLEAPSVHTDVLSHDGVENVIMHGAVGDGSTDDSGALQRAADAAAPNGTVYIPAGAVCYLANPVNIDLGLSDTEVTNENPDTRTNFSLICEGSVRPEGGLGDAIHVHHGTNPTIKMHVDGGGTDTTDCALYVSDMLGGDISVAGRKYAGTLSRIDNGTSKTVHTSYDYVYSMRCGRSLLIEEVVGFGEIGSVWEYNSVKNLTLRNANDISINQYENYESSSRTTQGVVVDSCSAIWIDKMLVGGDPSTWLAEFKVANKIDIGKLFALAGDGSGTQTNGVLLDAVSNMDASIYASGAQTKADVKIQDTLGGETTENISLELNITASMASGLVVDSSVIGFLDFTGFVKNAGQNGVPNIDIQTDSDIYLQRLTAYSSNASTDMAVPSGNSVWMDAESNIGSASGISGKPYRDGNEIFKSANSESPTATGTGPVLINFTDSGDGSGNGIYYEDREGTVHGPI